MPRVNIEDSAWKRILKLAKTVGCSEREAAGTVVWLWSESQEILRTDGTREEIIEWARLDDLSESERTTWIDALRLSRFIHLSKTNLIYTINGNDTQIEARISHMRRSAKGGEATKLRWSQLKSKETTGLEKAGHKPTSRRAGRQAITGGNPNQSKPNQTNPNQPKPIQVDRAAALDFEAIYQGYPRKEGKAAGMKRLAVKITSADELRLFAQAVTNYADLCAKRRTKLEHIKMWSSFIGVADTEPWRDYIDPPADLDPDRGLEDRKLREWEEYDAQRGAQV